MLDNTSFSDHPFLRLEESEKIASNENTFSQFECESARYLLLFYIADLFIIITKPYNYLMSWWAQKEPGHSVHL